MLNPAHNLVPVILAGGSGSRLWPLSQHHLPKPFLPLIPNHTTFGDCLKRAQGLSDELPILVLCNKEHSAIVHKQLKHHQCQQTTVLMEPCMRNTAPALVLAAQHIVKTHGDGVMVVLPADQWVENIDSFNQAIYQGVSCAAHQQLVTFGVTPTRAETGYGYIHPGNLWSANHQDSTKAGEVYTIERFTEKPDSETAESYLAEGKVFWNSGIFAFEASFFLAEMQKHAPAIYNQASLAYKNASQEGLGILIQEEALQGCPTQSIDNALMEHAQQRVVVPLTTGWSDLGSWDALWHVGDHDLNSNVSVGKVWHKDSQNNYVYADKQRVLMLNVKDLVVVDSGDGMLVANRDRSQEVGSTVKTLMTENEETASDSGNVEEIHREHHRPWGSYLILQKGPGYLIKRIFVGAGDKLSSQSHEYRSEHWTVLSGTATVEIEDETVTLTVGQSINIGINERHRLINNTDEPLEVLEVQFGDQLSEEDIVRYDDKYGRVAS